jgi:hypothetical protein
MHDLRARVHPAVGPARASDADFFTGDLREGVFYGVLYCAAAGLGLPAEKTAAVVLES